MKVKLQYFTTLASLVLFGNALAQSITVPTEVVIKGDTAVVALSFTAGGSTTNFDFTMTYDETVVDEAAIAIDCGAATGIGFTFLTCSVDTTGNTVKGIGGNFSGNPLTSGGFASVTLPVLAGAATGDSTNPFTGNFSASGTVTPLDDTWTLTVTDGPQPLFAATPTAVALSGQISTTLAADVVIDNSGGEATSMLDYTCTETDDASNKFTISGETSKVIGTAAIGTITVACDSSAIGGPFTGTMQCTHNGSNATPVDISLSCTVTAGPEPAFTGMATGLAMVATEQGDADPTASVAITNTGDNPTTLTGTCMLTGPDTEITMSNGAFSVNDGAAAHVVGLSCDAAAEGMYANTLSCTHNGTNVATPVDYAVTCEVGPPGPSVYASAPAAGSTIEMTPDGDVPVDATVADQVLTITNDAAEANDSDLALDCGWSGATAITAASITTPLAAQASTAVTFSCATAAVGQHTGTYTCDYGSGTGNDPIGVATYTVNCGVRVAASDILESPLSGTALPILVPINGTGVTSVSFAEILDEGEDASVDSCSFGTSVFSVVTALPSAVAAGSSLTVNVSGTDPGTGEISFTDTLTCTYSDSGSEAETVTWPITLTVLAQPIPTLSEWGLLLMILSLMGMGGMVIRRRVRS